MKLQASSFLCAQAIDKLPLLPGVLEIVGIGYTGVSSQAFLLAEALFYSMLLMNFSYHLSTCGMC